MAVGEQAQILKVLLLIQECTKIAILIIVRVAEDILMEEVAIGGLVPRGFKIISLIEIIILNSSTRKSYSRASLINHSRATRAIIDLIAITGARQVAVEEGRGSPLGLQFQKNQGN